MCGKLIIMNKIKRKPSIRYYVYCLTFVILSLCGLVFLLSSCTEGMIDNPTKPGSGKEVAVRFSLGYLSHNDNETVIRSRIDMNPETVVIPLEDGLSMYATLEVDQETKTRATTSGLTPGATVRIVAYEDGEDYRKHVDYTVGNNGSLNGDPFTVDEGYYTFVAYTYNKNSSILPVYGDTLSNIDVNNDLVWGIHPNNGNTFYVDANTDNIKITMSHKFSQVMLTATTSQMTDTPDIINIENVSVSGREANLSVKDGLFFKNNNNEVLYSFTGFSPLSTPTVISNSPSIMAYTGGEESTVLKIGSLTLDINGNKTFTNLAAIFNKQLKEGVSYHLQVNFRSGTPPGTILFELEGVAQETPATITFTNNSSRTATVNASGQIPGNKSEINLTVESLSLNGGAPVLIGRMGGETIRLKYNNGVLVHRDAVNDIIPIGTYAEIQLINTASGALAGNYKQESDINLMGKPWTPIGRGNNAANRFTGKYNGNGNMIHGLYINNTSLDYAGFFGYVGTTGITGEVKNLGVAGNVTGREWVGGIAGYAYMSRIENCFSTADIVAAGTTQNAGHRVGGIVGQIYYGSTLSNCFSTGNVTGVQDVGGIIGLVNSNSGSNVSVVENCYATGAVSGIYLAGGVAGQVNTGGVVRNSVALNPYVHSEPSVTTQYPVGRVAVKVVASNNSVNNYAWTDMGTNNGESFLLGTHATKQDVHNGYDGVSTNAATFRSAAFWTTTSALPTTPWTGWDTSIWSITNGKLPGLFNKTVELPVHLQ